MGLFSVNKMLKFVEQHSVAKTNIVVVFADRLLELIAPKKVAHAGCWTRTVCGGCGPMDTSCHNHLFKSCHDELCCWVDGGTLNCHYQGNNRNLCCN